LVTEIRLIQIRIIKGFKPLRINPLMVYFSKLKRLKTGGFAGPTGCSVLDGIFWSGGIDRLWNIFLL
jgi:hypothetical protein